jgi:hypothetical protein
MIGEETYLRKKNGVNGELWHIVNDVLGQLPIQFIGFFSRSMVVSAVTDMCYLTVKNELECAIFILRFLKIFRG